MRANGKPIRADCRRCGAKNARGIRYIESDAIVEFECGVCGRTMWMGHTQEDNEGAIQSREGRLKAERNRARYMRERDEETKRYLRKSSDTFGKSPDIIANFYDSMNPGWGAIDD